MKNPTPLRLPAAAIALCWICACAGCADEPAQPHPDAGRKLFEFSELADRTEDGRFFVAASHLLNMEPENVRAHVDRDLDNAAMGDDPESSCGRVFFVRGGLARIQPRRDGTTLPEGIDEIWEGIVVDLVHNQPYIVVHLGVPDVELIKERVVVTGVFTDLRTYRDRADREQVAPVLVTNDIRQMVMK